MSEKFDTTGIPLLPSTGLWSIESTALPAIRRALERVDLLASFQRSAESMKMGDELQLDGSTAVIPVMGPMEKRSSWFGMWMGWASTERIRRQVERATGDATVKTILLRIDSPGGTVDGLAELGDTVFRARDSKRVVAQVDGMAASAAYYVAAQASEINAGRLDLIGSIGVKFVLWDSSKAFELAGIKVIPVDTGDFKSAGEPGTEITDAHVAHFQGLVDATFADFQKAVSRGRGMNAAAVKAVADGRVWLAAEAKSLGLIDTIQTLDGTMAKLRGKRAAGEPPAMSAKLLKQRFEFLHKESA